MIAHMASSSEASSDTIKQLNAARALALGDANFYSAIVPGVLPLIGPTTPLDLRRWGTEFLAETFASPTLDSEGKEKLSIGVLQSLKDFLDSPGEDTAVIKCVVQAAASIYPLVFRHVINHPNEASVWEQMSAIRSNILQRMDTAPPGVRVCCIKFVQCVVQTQTPGLIADPRRPEHNEISLALVPRDHPILNSSMLEAQASGLLDRLLSILQENSSDALLITATLNCFGGLIKSRASISNKIINTVLNFNPLKLANAPMTPRNRVMIKSMERTTKALLLSVLKKNTNHPLAGRIQQYLERMQHSRTEIFDEANRKRPAPIEPTDGFDSAKRQRLVPGMPQQFIVPPLPPGPVSFSQLFTLTEDPGSKNFDVQAIPIDIVNRILVPMIQSIEKSRLDSAINAVQARYLSLSKQQRPGTALDAATAVTGKPAPLGADEEEEDYEPDYEPTEDAEQIINKLDTEGSDSMVHLFPPEVPLGPFKLPQPPPLSGLEVAEYSKVIVRRIFEFLNTLDDGSVHRKRQKAGFNRLAASGYDRDAWVTVLARLATRAPAGLSNGFIEAEEVADGPKRRGGAQSFSIEDSIREALNLYVLQDFRRRIDVAIAWLNEEWYNDRIQALQREHGGERNGDGDLSPPDKRGTYRKWVLKLLDELLPYLEAKDQKILIRFLSEVPEVDAAVLDRVKKLAADPERVKLSISSIYYLIMFRPPVREISIDALEDLWRFNEDARLMAAKYLMKWRPHVLQEVPNGAAGEVKAES